MEAEHSERAAGTEDRGSERSGADPAGEEPETEGGGGDPAERWGGHLNTLALPVQLQSSAPHLRKSQLPENRGSPIRETYAIL